MKKILLQMKDIVKLFPGIRALDNVNFEVEEGEIHALVGENGAGKSTLMNVLSGIHPHGSYDGQIVYDGEECKFNNIRDSEKKGIVIIHQELAMVPYMTIGENMFLGNECHRTTGGNSSFSKLLNFIYEFKIDWDKTFNKADELLKIVGLKESSHTLINDISIGKQQLVEIAKALAKDVRLLILDEPTASLNEDDSEKLLELLLKLKKDGVTSILISHKLGEVSKVADHITILRDGATIETLDKNIDDISEPRIIKGMVGRELSDRFPKRNGSIGEINLEVKDWTVYHPIYAGRKVCDNVSFNVRRGEVVGISGLMGAGRTELAMSIFGKSYGRNISGRLFINGKEVNLKNVEEAIKQKIAYVSEDRKNEGLILSNSIKINTTMSNMGRVSKWGKIDKDKEINAANEYCDKLNTKCTGVEQNVGDLSGGNQQKVLLSKWMFTEPDIMILDEPTRGIDVGAKYEIYNIINGLVAEKKSVLLISSEMPEILGICDRIYVMNDGRIVAEFEKTQASQEAILASILQSDKVV